MIVKVVDDDLCPLRPFPNRLQPLFSWIAVGAFDYQPAKIFIHRLIRPVFVRTDNRDAAPLIAKLPPRL